jgi:hypothetical protein
MGAEVSGKLHAPSALPPGKSPRYPLHKGLGGPRRWYGRCGEDKKCLASNRNRTRAVQLLAHRFNEIKTAENV